MNNNLVALWLIILLDDESPYCIKGFAGVKNFCKVGGGGKYVLVSERKSQW